RPCWTGPRGAARAAPWSLTAPNSSGSSRPVTSTGSSGARSPRGRRQVASARSPHDGSTFDDHRVVYVSSLAIGSNDGGSPPSGEDLVGSLSAFQGADVIEHAVDRIVARARFRPVEGGRIALVGASAVAGFLATSTITIDEADREWALDTWRSIRSL